MCICSTYSDTDWSRLGQRTKRPPIDRPRAPSSAPTQPEAPPVQPPVTPSEPQKHAAAPASRSQVREPPRIPVRVVRKRPRVGTVGGAGTVGRKRLNACPDMRETRMRRSVYLGVILWILLASLHLPTTWAESGAERAMKLETLSKSEQGIRAKSREDLGKFVSECLERKAGPMALEALDVLEALGSGETDLEALRGEAKALSVLTRDAKTWGGPAWKKLAQQIARAWRNLMKKALKQGVVHAACRYAGIVVLLDPNDARARAVLGHTRVKGLWMSKFDAAKSKLGTPFDPAWGYVSKATRKKLESGLRPLGASWIPEDEEARATRSWEQRCLWDDPTVVVVSNLAFDESLAVYVEARSFVRSLDEWFGDGFGPTVAQWPITLYLCRTIGDVAEAGKSRGGGVRVGSRFVCMYDKALHAVVANAAGDPKVAQENYTLRDHIAKALLEWYLADTIGDNSISESPNLWVKLGLQHLALGRALFEPTPEEPFGWLRDYALTRNSLPAVSDLLKKTYKSRVSRNDFTQSAALCHFLMHAEGGAHRLEFLGVAREFLTGDPSAEDLPNALGMKAEEIESKLNAYMSGLVK